MAASPGAEVVECALAPRSDRDVFVFSGLQEKVTHQLLDVREFDALAGLFELHQPEFVFHLVALPLVRESRSA